MVEYYFRLRGDVEGFERCFTVRPGENLIGSRTENHIVLQDRSVSRRHALLVAGPGRLTLEDLASTNGTRVNGRLIDSATLRTGDRVSFGSVALKIEKVEASDADLAIAVDTPPWSSHTGTGDSTGAYLEEESWVSLLEAMTASLIPGEADLARMICSLVRALPAHAGCLLEWDGEGDPVVVAGVGSFRSSLQESAIRTAFRSASCDKGCIAAIVEGRVPSACVVCADELDVPIGLVIAGDFPRRSESIPLLRTALNLFCLARGRPFKEQPFAPASHPELTFLPGFVVGESAAMMAVFREMRSLLIGELPVLIVGETGVGKEYIAQTLHFSSIRAKMPFQAINCAAIPADLLEAELFGIGRGVATGVAEREGRFQQAEGGTLFLDEIADMAPGLQAKLLRALQEREVHPVGGRQPVPVNVSVMAATNSDPRLLLESGRLRADLYYRLAGSVLEIPPLRRRREDIPHFVEHFVRVCSSRTKKQVKGITFKALSLLTDYHWPGNVRELEHEMRRAVNLCPPGQAVDCTVLHPYLLATTRQVSETEEEPADLRLDRQIERLERDTIRRALRRAQGNRSEAARLLGISRNGLASKLERLGIEGL